VSEGIILAEATGSAKVEILLVAGCTVNHVLPVLIAVDFLVSGRSTRKILQYLGSRTTMPLGIRVQGLHGFLILAL
jgi:hypothetical protein